jgi:predicted O-methyltransferase YrrM
MKPAEEVDLARLVQERDELKAHCLRLAGEVNCLRIAQFNASLGFPPGHFYSPVVDVDDPHVVRSVRDPQPIRDSAGIHMDQPGMEALCERLARHLPHFPFTRERQAGFRFFYDNPAFGAHDAAVLFSMLLEYRPRRVVEVGSGYSSCLMLDTSERFLDGKLQLALIDPTLTEIRARVPLGSAHGVEMIPVKVQDAPISVFESLQENDILFLDSSHVAKCGSDVNYYLFEILPFLAPGVLIHIHDILYPFEYPEQWVLEGKRSWNEAYAVRAFLQYNREFTILYWTSFATHVFPEKLWALMPIAKENPGGSLWLRTRARARER